MINDAAKWIVTVNGQRASRETYTESVAQQKANELRKQLAESASKGSQSGQPVGLVEAKQLLMG